MDLQRQFFRLYDINEFMYLTNRLFSLSLDEITSIDLWQILTSGKTLRYSIDK